MHIFTLNICVLSDSPNTLYVFKTSTGMGIQRLSAGEPPGLPGPNLSAFNNHTGYHDPGIELPSEEICKGVVASVPGEYLMVPELERIPFQPFLALRFARNVGLVDHLS